MMAGDWAAAWAVSDHLRRPRGTPVDHALPRHEQAVWDGTPPDGRRVLVRCQHGLGDTIQFIRFAPMLRAAATDLTIWAQPALIPLLRTMGDIGRLLPLHDGDPGVAHDVDMEVMELPQWWRPTIATLPAAVPYLHPPATVSKRGGGVRVGLVWQGGDWNPARSVPLRLLQPLAEIEGVDLALLQRGPALGDAPPGFGRDAGSDDVLEAARIMMRLDLVITIDSMTAHLAGALGRPVWVLLARDADWRWMDGRSDSPWYPSMTLFRQPRPGDWAPVVDRVAHALRHVAAQPRSAITRTGIDFAAGTWLSLAWCQTGSSGLHSG